MNSRTNAQDSDYYLQPGSFVRLQNAAIGYTFHFVKSRLRARVYLAGQNLILLTGYKGYDPEVSEYGQDVTGKGIDYGTYPRARTFTGGMQLNF